LLLFFQFENFQHYDLLNIQSECYDKKWCGFQNESKLILYAQFLTIKSAKKNIIPCAGSRYELSIFLWRYIDDIISIF